MLRTLSRRKQRCLFCAASLLLIVTAHSQQTDGTIWLNDSALAREYALYRSNIGGASRLYNGPEYTAAYPGTSGTPFFGPGFFVNGSVSYNGIHYYDVPIAFDLVSNQVVIKGYQGLSMQLRTENVDSFLITGHSFVKLNADARANIAEGFYEVVYLPSIAVYIKRTRQVARSFNAEDPLRFLSYDYFFIRSDSYYAVDGKKSLLHLFHDQSGALKKFWKSKHIDFKNEKEAAILNTVRFYVNNKS